MPVKNDSDGRLHAFQEFPGFVTNVGIVLLAVMLVPSAASAATKEKLPSFSKIQSAVAAHFDRLPDYKAGDIISREDAAPIFLELKKLGWTVSDEKDILDDMLDEQNFLVKELRTTAGRDFMHKVSRDPTVYDRLDRVAEHKRGEATIRSLIKLPNGEIYAQANPGRGYPNLSDLVLMYDRGSAQERKLKDFDKPTGTIYTVDGLVLRLKKSYQKAVSRPHDGTR